MLKTNLMKPIASLVLALMTTFQVVAQEDNVGIGTTTPHPSAKLDIAEAGANKKGLLIPRVTQIQLLNFENQYPVDGVADGLLVYEEELGQFWYYKWDSPVPANPPYGQWVNVATGTQTVNSNVPVGGIIMWSGTTSSIPSGWSLCNGSNGTPDLTDKFVISIASAAENPGTAAVPNFYVNVEPGATVAPDRRFFKLAYIMKLP